jgi:hypothetical protein
MDEYVDPDTGEIIEAPKPRKGRYAPRELSNEEREHLEERREHYRTIRGALEAMSPALMAEGDPRLKEDGLLPLKRTRTKPLVDVPRTSGTGVPGTHLIVSERDHDGVGAYALVYVTYYGAGSHKFRSRGTAIREDELRAVGEALIAMADRLDAEDEP